MGLDISRPGDRALDRLDLGKLMTFLAIAEAGGVTPAARRLALTRSAVSHSLGALEARLGLPLFHRVGKRLVLTNEGRRLRAAASEARDRLTLALDELLGEGAQVRGPVRLGLFLGFSRFRLAAVVRAFLRAHPQAQVRIAFGPQAWLLEQLLAAKLDLTLSLRPKREQSANVRSEQLFVQSLVLAARRSARPAPPADFAALSRLSVVDYYQSDPLIDRWTRHHWGGRRIPRDRIRAWAASTDLALELALGGVGAAVLPEDVVEPYRRRGRLQVIEGPREALRDAIWLNQLRGARAGRALAVFREQLVASLAGPPPR
jgi:DNA-binding transcriptional LysR family regulator